MCGVEVVVGVGHLGSSFGRGWKRWALMVVLKHF